MDQAGDMTPIASVTLLGPDGQQVTLTRNVGVVSVHPRGSVENVIVAGQGTSILLYPWLPSGDDMHVRATVRKVIVPLLVLSDESVHSTLFTDVEDEVMRYLSALFWPV